jgi:hypothetical protein
MSLADFAFATESHGTVRLTIQKQNLSLAGFCGGFDLNRDFIMQTQQKGPTRSSGLSKFLLDQLYLFQPVS